MIDLQGVTKTYPNGVCALDGVDLHIEKGEFVFVVGHSGAGKSTFLQCLNYLLPPDSGDIWLEGKKVNARDTRELCALRQQVGMIFQDFNLIPILTAEENIIMPLLLDGKKPDKTKLRELAGFLGIENRLKHLPGELSGGQRQRVAIARALINDPVILLAAEPTGNLDKKAADEIMELLLAVNRRGNTVLLVTHEQRYADLCGRKIEISDGRI